MTKKEIFKELKSHSDKDFERIVDVEMIKITDDFFLVNSIKITKTHLVFKTHYELKDGVLSYKEIELLT